MTRALFVAVAGQPGRLVDPETPVLHADDRGAMLGDGVFETVEVLNGDAPLWPEHEARLRAAAAALRLPVPWSAAELRAAVRTVATAIAAARAVARVVVTRGRGSRGYAPPAVARPTLLVQLFDAPSAPPPWRLAVLDAPRTDSAALTWTHKTLAAAERVRAAAMARTRGAHEGLLLGPRAALACTTAANLFWVRGGTLYTPHPRCGLRPGVARGFVLRLAPELGLRPREGCYPLAALDEADEVFATNALIHVQPVVEVIGRRTWAPGAWTRLLGEAYAQALRTVASA